MTKFLAILFFFFLADISSYSGAVLNYVSLKADPQVNTLKSDVYSTSTQDSDIVPDLNEDENEIALSLPWVPYTNHLGISYTPCYCTSFFTVDVIPRPPEA